MEEPPTKRPAVLQREPRWQGALALIGEMRRQPGVTRAEAARRQGLSTGSATEIVSRLRRLALIEETPKARGTRGRPTHVLVPHPRGPVVIMVDIRQNGWRCAYAGIDGELVPIGSELGADKGPDDVITGVGAILRQGKRRFGARLSVVSVAVAGTVQTGQVVHSSTLGWQAVDMTSITKVAGLGHLPLLVGNDATLAGMAEARRGAAIGTATSLHLSVEVGIGGALVSEGNPVAGATGAGGEFGHLPFGDPTATCPCGARGCWDLEVDGRALARLLGDPAPRDPYRYAVEVISKAAGNPRVRSAIAHVAKALGRGIAGLVNAHDPEIVTLGGLGPLVIDAAREAFDEAYRQGLMSFRRGSPPTVLTAIYREDGSLRGATEMALDVVLSENSLSAWSTHRLRPPPMRLPHQAQ